MIQHFVSRIFRTLSLASPAILASVCLVLPVAAQAPSTDIGVVSVTLSGTLAKNSFVRVTDRPLYDNQPSFLSSDVLFYTAMQEATEGVAASTEIVRYGLKSGTRRTVVATPESEYSATKIPEREAISVVRDYGELKQQLWSYTLGAPGPAKAEHNLLPGINPVGYHAWVDDKRLILFVLGEPATLQLATVGPDAGRVLAENPGRALARIPQTDRMSFVHKVSEKAWWLCAINVDDENVPIQRLIQMPEGTEDYAWSPDGWVWTGQGPTLLKAKLSDAMQWQEVADLTESGVHNISRLAFDATGQRLALVFER